jgi:hypothetical protein
MADNESLSGLNLSLADIAKHHTDLEKALRLYFSEDAPTFEIRFFGYSLTEVKHELNERLTELEMTSSLTILSAVEAAFRIDYIQRYDEKKKDPISKKLRTLYKIKQAKASLDEDIFEIWKEHITGGSPLIADLRGAFKLRHWLAHGRYWTRKFGRTYDYFTVYSIAERTLNSFPLLGS